MELDVRGQSTQKRKAESVPIDEWLGGEGDHSAEPLDPADGPQELALTDERTRLLHQALEELPPRMKQCDAYRPGPHLPGDRHRDADFPGHRPHPAHPCPFSATLVARGTLWRLRTLITRATEDEQERPPDLDAGDSGRDPLLPPPDRGPPGLSRGSPRRRPGRADAEPPRGVPRMHPGGARHGELPRDRVSRLAAPAGGGTMAAIPPPAGRRRGCQASPDSAIADPPASERWAAESPVAPPPRLAPLLLSALRPGGWPRCFCSPPSG